MVNTGWVGGEYGVGRRMNLPATREIIDEILNGNLLNAEFVNMPYFNLQLPTAIAGKKQPYLNPRDMWEDPTKWDEAAENLAKMFIKNFEQFTDNPEAAKLVAAGPKV